MSTTAGHARVGDDFAFHDAFLSYKRSDARVVRNLRWAVQYAGVPWLRWRRERRLRLYLDTSGLGAGPDLRAQLYGVLARCRWLIVVASPAAASTETPYIGDEITWWLRNRSADTILIALVAGADPVWRGGHFDTGVPGNAIHPALARCYAAEPNWVDLRGLRSRGSQFRLRAAALAAALLNMGDRKDELVREVARQHRRTRVTAVSTAAAVVLVIGLLAVFGLGANRQAVEQTRIAGAGALVEQARATLADTPDVGLRYGIAAHELTGASPERAALVTLLATTPFDGALPGTSTPVTAAAHGPDGQLAIGTANGELLLSGPSGLRSPTLVGTGAGSALSTLAFSDDGRMLFGGSADGTGRWWTIDGAGSPRLVTTMQVHPEAVRVARFGPQGLLATIGDDGLVLWHGSGTADVRELRRGLPELADAQALAFGPPGRSPSGATSDATVLFVATPLPSVMLIDVTDPSAPIFINQETPDIGPQGSLVALSPDGRMLAAAFDSPASVGVWSASTVFPTPESPTSLFGRPTGLRVDGEVTALSFAPDGRTLLVGTRPGGLATVDLTLPNEPETVSQIAADDRAVTLVSASADGRTVLTGSGDAVRFWATARAHPPRLHLVPGPAEDPESPMPGVVDEPTAHAGVAAMLDEDGSVLSGLFSGGYRERWTLPGNRDPQQTAPGYSPFDRGQYAMDLDAAGRLLLVGLDDGTVAVIEVDDDGTEQDVGSFAVGGPVADVDLAPDGRTALVIDRGGEVTTWSLADRASPRRLAVLLPGGRSTGVPRRPDVAITAAGLAVVSSPFDGVSLWDVTDPAAPRRRSIVTTADTESVALDPMGRSLVVKEVTNSAGDVSAALWDITAPDRPRMVRALTNDSAPAAAYSPDGRILVTGSGRDGLAVWDLVDLEHPNSLLTLSNHTSRVTAAAFSGDGRRLATADVTGRFVVVDLGPLTDAVRDPVRAACDSAGRGLDEHEWAAQLPGIPFRPTCR